MSASFISSAGPDALKGRKVLIIVENLPLPFDRRVWLEARTLKAAGAEVSIICPTGKGHEAAEEDIDGIHIYRHDLPPESEGAIGYLREYLSALVAETRLAWKIFFKHGFDVIHGCNPPDLIFLVALPFKLFGKKFVFDHHDINPELYEAKFNRRDMFWRLLRLVERLTFKTADVSIATNESYRAIAVERGGMDPEKVFVVRSGPDIEKLKPAADDPELKRGRRFMVGYVGVMGEQEGIDLLLESVRHIVHDLGRRDIQFTLAGSGPALESLQALSHALKVEDHVAFLGRVPDAELFALLSTADLCVNPDRVNTMNDLSTMNKIMEYMAFSKPIVQFDVKEGRYSAQHSSLYARKNDPRDFAERILDLLGDEKLRQEMGEFGRRRVVRELCWRNQIPTLLNAYLSALGNGREMAALNAEPNRQA
ncbi:glycosyltransferase involved in cell wall biosynthesis [Rhodoblastus acidophilus]|uniref:glycosyltransferase family 4 protein n=1 Tax=Rhodoblastus acidophilus TaxID=1074 RepID=UPI0022246E1B|nr:glycosyltransferase family 4 protein [Rhodoblastus acidophilus]MCW2318643.1 glycosyltransferase involved in cell wall biosynthesis [Rhodoblastus acidophilus]